MKDENRILAAVRELVGLVLPQVPFLAMYRYRVARQVEERVDLQAVRKIAGLPDAPTISIQPGMAGLKAVLTPGAVVLVQFIEGDPSLPVVTHFARPEEGGWIPVTLVLDASDTVEVGPTASAVEVAGGGAAIARKGDTVGALCLDSTGATLFWSPSQAPLAVYVPIPTAAAPGSPLPSDVGIPLVIDSGSAKATCG